MAELEKLDVYACALPMPNPNEPLLLEWLAEMHRCIVRDVADDIYLIGHSLGGTVILRYLEQYESKNVKGVVIVSAPCHRNNNRNIDTFLTTDFNWELLRTRNIPTVVIHGDNDPYVPVSDAEEIAKELSAPLTLIPNGRHLNGSAGFVELPEAIRGLCTLFAASSASS